jgi:dethiobiotin synthetase
VKNGIFITGTDTGVGKTFIGTGIVTALRNQGIDVGVMKPAESGCKMRAGSLVPWDSVELMKAAGSRDPLDLVNPCRYRAPLAPAVAAAQEGKAVEIRKILSSFRSLCRRHAFMVVEGAGGIMVPLSCNRTYLDLAEDLGLPVLIVARPGLGTINHTLLTVMALRQRKLSIAGIVINYSERKRPGAAESTNPEIIKGMSGIPVLFTVRYGQRDLDALARMLHEEPL